MMQYPPPSTRTPNHPYLTMADATLTPPTDEHMWNAINRLAGIVETHHEAMRYAGLLETLQKAGHSAVALIKGDINTKGYENKKQESSGKPYGDVEFSGTTLNKAKDKYHQLKGQIKIKTAEISTLEDEAKRLAKQVQVSEPVDHSKEDENVTNMKKHRKELEALNSDLAATEKSINDLLALIETDMGNNKKNTPT